MGMNTAVIIRNDCLNDIENDKDFGKKLSQAIQRSGVYRGPVSVSAGSSVNAADVITCHHADTVSLIAFGGNHASLLGTTPNGGKHYNKEEQLKVLKAIAEDMGYWLIEKPDLKKE